MSLPPIAPRYRSIIRLQRFMRNPIPFMNENLKKYGDTYCFSLRYNKVNILTIDPDLIQHILRKNVDNYEKPVASTSALGQFIGKGVLLATGDYHTQQRKLMAPGFRPKSISKLIEKVDFEIEAYFKNLDQKITQTNFIEIGEELRVMTFRIMSRSIFGDSLDNKGIDNFYNRFQTLQGFLSKIVRIPSLIKWYNFNGKTKYYESISRQNSRVLLELIKERRSHESQNDLLSMLMQCNYEDSGKGMNDQQLLDESLILIVAGHETATNILSWIFYILAKHPEVIQKIKTEAKGVFENGTPDFSRLLQLEYLNQVIDEALRLYPPSWITDRVALADDRFKDFDIPAGSRIIPFIYGLHHSEKLWHEPEAFRPERFEKEARKQRHNFAHLPFGAGPRMCLGRNFAMLEMKMIILKILNRYQIELHPKQNISLLPAVTLKPRYGIKLNLRKL